MGETVGDINIYKWEVFIETDVTHDLSYRLDAYYILRTENIRIHLEIILNEFTPLCWRCRQFVSSKYW